MEPFFQKGVISLNLFQSFYVKPAANELVETTVHIQPDPRPALVGTVLSEKRPVQDALVAIYLSGGQDAPDQPVGSLYTDELGHFAFGPLEPQKLYQVRVFKAGPAARSLELSGS